MIQKVYMVQRKKVVVWFTGQNIIKNNKFVHTSALNSQKIFEDYVLN
jgi:hypothetical protein